MPLRLSGRNDKEEAPLTPKRRCSRWMSDEYVFKKVVLMPILPFKLEEVKPKAFPFPRFFVSRETPYA